MANKLKHLFCILMGKPVFIESMGWQEVYPSLSKYVYFIPHPNYRKEKIDIIQQYHVSLPKIETILNDVLNKWFEIKCESSLQVFVSTIIDSNLMTLEDIFLRQAKALESYHRDTVLEKGYFIDENDYKQIVEIMITSVEDRIIQSLKDKLKSTLKHANQYGFQKRIKDVIRMLPEELRVLVLAGGKLSKFAKDITDNRDYYTHYGKKPDNLFDFKQLISMRTKLKVALLYAYLKELGLDDDLINQCILEDYRIAQQLNAKKKEVDFEIPSFLAGDEK
ncbi:HEPN domain-containing protein [Bacillus sp. JJ722]|uniref:HEPN domain-containing protein n=1 Tax=Bacillus sp. JJ722 TaxID=3122973 RepID=UPI002FFF331F